MGSNDRSASATWFRSISYGLGRKLTIILCALIVLFVSATLVVNYYTQSEMIDRRLDARASTYSNMLLNVSTNYLYNLNVADLEAILEETLRKPYIGYVHVLDASGFKVADGNFQDRDASFLQLKSDEIAEDAMRSRRVVKVLDHEVLHLGLPVILNNKLLGTVRLGFLLDDMKAELALVRERNLLIGAAFMLIGMMISSILSGKLAGPLRSLTAAIEAAGKGNLNQTISFRTNDEIETLAHSFNHMLDNMRDNVSKINFLAYNDQLTGLPNRASCQKELQQRFSSRVSLQTFALVQIDFDKFKRLNDTLGHAAGDQLLRVLGARFTAIAAENPNFQFYRWGGDEFVAIVDYDADSDIDVFLKKLSEQISVPINYEAKLLTTTVSLGVARYPEDAKTLHELMIFSDLALYRTKELGRNGVQFFTHDMKTIFDREAEIETELRIAIEQKQFKMFYQPQVDVATGDVWGFEALIRWDHPSKGILSPGVFLQVAENAGLASSIGRLVLEDVMSAARYWKDQNIPFQRLAMNLSPEHLKSGHFLQDFFKTMEAYNIDPNRLTVEILESYIIDDPESDVASIMSTLRNCGVGVELDDFGTGYASLAHLSALPVTGLKIDRSFIQQMTDDEKRGGIVSALLSLSKLLGLHVICEGVETNDQILALRELNKCSIQGYAIARPMPRENVAEWISEWSGKTKLANLTKEILTKKVG